MLWSPELGHKNKIDQAFQQHSSLLIALVAIFGGNLVVRNAKLQNQINSLLFLRIYLSIIILLPSHNFGVQKIKIPKLHISQIVKSGYTITKKKACIS